MIEITKDFVSRIFLEEYPLLDFEKRSRIEILPDWEKEELSGDVLLIHVKGKKVEKNAEKEVDYLLPRRREITWMGRRWISPLVFIPSRGNWRRARNSNVPLDWKDGIYVPAYILRFVHDVLEIFSSDKSSGLLRNMMPPVEERRFVVFWDKNGDDNFYAARYPVWYDVTHESKLTQESYRELVILPLFSEHDVPSYRKFRAVVESQKGIICPIHTPESKKMGFYVFRAKGARYDEKQLKLVEARKREEAFSTAVLHIPYVRYSDGPRVMMGAKNYRQAVKVRGAEEPIIHGSAELEYLGVNALVVYGLYKGYTIEDGIVVSRSFAEKMHVEDEVVVSFVIGDGVLRDLIRRGKIPAEGQHVEPWQVLVSYQTPDGTQKKVVFPYFVEGTVQAVEYSAPEEFLIFGTMKPKSKDQMPVEVRIRIKIERPLMVGDKLTGRHGNKGVVSKILPDEDMPRVKMGGKWIPADVILTPLGVISRKNIGALIETSFSVAKRCGGLEVPEGTLAEVSDEDVERIRDVLMWLGADRYGRFEVELDGRRFRTLAGYQYILRLHHHAEGKLSVRMGTGEDGKRKFKYNFLGQPVGGRKNGGGQRMGEMEVWTVMSHGKRGIMDYLLTLTGQDRALNAYEFLLKLMGIRMDIRGGQVQFRMMKKADYEGMVKSVSSLDDVGDEEKLYKVGETGYYLPRYLWPYFTPKIEWDRTSKATEPVVGKGFEVRKPYWKKFLALFGGMSVKYLGRASAKKGKRFKLSKIVFGEYEDEGSPGLLVIDAKQGLMRRFILGKRLELSGRAVIVPEPSLDLDEVYLPRTMWKAFDWGEGEEHWVLLGRQPSLHRHSIQSFRAKVWDEMAIGVNPMICSGFGADFDGDTMWVVGVKEEKERLLLKELVEMTLKKNFFLLRSGKPAILFGHDYAWGYFVSQEGSEPIRRFIDGSAELEGFVPEGVEKLDDAYFAGDDYLEKVERLNEYLDVATYYPPSFTYFMARDGHPFMMLLPVSGARGSEGAVKEITEVIELEDWDGVRVKISPFVKGLDMEGLWLVARRGRNSMMDKKLTVAASGGTTRRMVYGLAHLKWRDVKDFVFAVLGEVVDPATREPFPDDFPIGVCAGQVLGERATQLAMKTFHSGGKAVSGERFLEFMMWVRDKWVRKGTVKRWKYLLRDGDLRRCLRLLVPSFVRETSRDETFWDAEAKFLKDIINSFHPLWLLIAIQYMKDLKKEPFGKGDPADVGLGYLAYSPSYVKDIARRVKKEKVHETRENNLILDWLGVVRSELDENESA